MSEKAEKDMSFLLYIFDIDKLWKVTVSVVTFLLRMFVR